MSPLDVFQPGKFSWGAASKARLQRVHPVMVEVASAALHHSPLDFTIAAGWRSQEKQDELYEQGLSQVRWPRSRHNYTAKELDVEQDWAETVGQALSMAIDVAPFIDGRARFGNDRKDEILWLNGLVVGIGMPIALSHGFYLRTGADWNMDGKQREERFRDLFHVELRRLR